MPTPPEVQYKNAVIRDSLLEMNIKNLQFNVVNNPKPNPYYEDLPTVESVPGEITTGPIKAALLSIEWIYTPDFRVGYMSYGPGVLPFPLDSYDSSMTIVNTSDESKCSESVIRTNKLGLVSAYANRYNVGLYGSTETTYTFSDGSKQVLYSDHKLVDTSLTYDYIPLTTIFKSRGGALENVPTIRHEVMTNHRMVMYVPYKKSERFDLAANQQSNRLYKFDTIKVKPNETVSTVVFSDSQSALLHVCEGSVTTEGFTVDSMNFYEYDATAPLSVTAGPNGATIVCSIHVPSIDIA